MGASSAAFHTTDIGNDAARRDNAGDFSRERAHRVHGGAQNNEVGITSDFLDVAGDEVGEAAHAQVVECSSATRPQADVPATKSAEFQRDGAAE